MSRRLSEHFTSPLQKSIAFDILKFIVHRKKYLNISKRIKRKQNDIDNVQIFMFNIN